MAEDILGGSSDVLGGDVAAVQSEIRAINQGENWAEGERQFGYTAQNTTGGKKLEINQGSNAAPDEGNEVVASISRVLKVSESLFSGDGAGQLAAFKAHTTAVAGSQGQSIGIVGSAITFGTYEAGHSLADGIGGYFLGISKGSSTRTGMGAFVNGRRETSTARATGMELCVTNEVASAAQEFTGALPGTLGMHLHTSGQSQSAAGIIVRAGGAETNIPFHTAFGIMNGSVTDAVLADYSEAKRTILIKGKKSKASIAVAKEAGPVLFGVEEAANAAAVFEVNQGALTAGLDPMINFKAPAGKSSRVRLIENGGTGQVNAWVSAAVNAFVEGSASGDSGFGFGPGTTFHIGANAKKSVFRLAEAGVGFYGKSPVVQPETTGTKGTGFTEVGGTAVKTESTFTGGVGATAYTLSDVVKNLKTIGLLKE